MTIEELSVAIGANLTSLDKGLKDANRKLDSFSKDVEKNNRQMETSFTKVGTVLSAAFAVDMVDRFGGAMIGLGGEVVNTYGKFEKLQSLLSNTFQSKTLGAVAIAQLQTAAKDLPGSLEDATTAFLKLQNSGVNPTITEMRAFADVSANAGKGLDIFAEAVNDATRGEFERLKEFFIDASVKGDKVAFTFKGITTEVDKNDKAIKDYLVSLGKVDGVMGAAGVQMDTVSGKLSNMTDSWDRLFTNLGKQNSGVIAGTLDLMIDKLDAVANALVSVEDRGLANAASAIKAQFDSIQGDFERAAKTAKEKGEDIQTALAGLAKQNKDYFSPKLAEAQQKLNAYLDEEGSKLDQLSRNLRTATEEQKNYDATVARLSGDVQLYQSILNELPTLQDKATKAVQGTTAAMGGLIDQLEKRIKAQKAVVDSATSEAAIASGNAALKNLEDQLEAYRKLGTQNSLEVVTDKLEKYYEVLANPDASEKSINNTIKRISIFEREKEMLESLIDATLRAAKGYQQTVEEISTTRPSIYTGQESAGSGTPISLIDRISSQKEITPETRKLSPDEFAEEYQRAGGAVVEVNSLIAGSLAGLISTSAQAFGELAMGVGSIENVFSMLLGQVASFVKSFGEAMIQSGTAALIAETALFVNPGIAIAAGAALVAFGSAMSSGLKFGSDSGGGKKQRGGAIPQYEQGTNYVPFNQLAFLHKGEAVVPAKFNPASFAGMASKAIEVFGQFRAEGREMVATLEAYGYSNMRTG
jgi:O6-methylguanine-DNA--protein-cysteine methyltransferase